MSTILKKRYKSPNPALNVRPRDEPVATDTIYSDTPAIDCGVTSAQLFVGTKTHTADVYPIRSDKQFVNTLLDNITQCGAPTKLISERAQVEISERVKQVLRPLHISARTDVQDLFISSRFGVSADKQWSSAVCTPTFLMSHVGRVAASPPGSKRTHASKKDAMKNGSWSIISGSAKSV
jgi:hypothetical protein